MKINPQTTNINALNILFSKDTIPQKPRKYWRVIFMHTPEGKIATKHDGFILLRPNQLKTYAETLGCTLMRHLPANLKP